MTPMTALALFSALFVGTHFLMSHPLRAAMVARLGERGFAGVYSLISLLLFGGMIWAYGPAVRTATEAWWAVPTWLWWVATLLMWLGSVLFVGSLRRNPAFPNPGKPITSIGEARGTFAVTRHPMMWGFALWALVHALVVPNCASFILSGAILVLALGGAAGQDAKKRKLMGAPWVDWQRRTAFVPFAKGFALPDAFALAGGTILWLVATWAHGALGYMPAGIFAFVS
ncbi:NnrU family protein [Sphingomonas rhizophila]|uniref:NnrU family protein n=1 Tax=Sphingomonas rhizophila TaxID=2071607 RepID=A0A7G9SCW2_9SPHN|nr:NnrU family protein [Sphingomonas rhizophila]QNN65687.1 NnrU family protein [Sphingomonas rhizophila]